MRTLILLLVALSAQACAAAPAALPGTVKSPTDVDVRQKGAGKARIALLAQGKNAFVGRLELAPNVAVPEHQDATEEYIYVLAGGGMLTMDGKVYAVEPGSIIFMPANATVSFQNGPDPMVGLQIFAGPDPARKYETWQPEKN